MLVFDIVVVSYLIYCVLQIMYKYPARRDNTTEAVGVNQERQKNTLVRQKHNMCLNSTL